jgi:hypothetical protein
MKKIIISISLSIICLVVGIFSFLTNDLTAYHHWMADNGPKIMENFRRDKDRGNTRKADRRDREDSGKNQRDDRDRRGPMRESGNSRDHHQGPGMGPNDGHHQGPDMNRPSGEKSTEENK